MDARCGSIGAVRGGASKQTEACEEPHTPSELRVLLAVVQGGGVGEVADALGISEATVKTHLHRLFAKTDTRRQAELVKLVAGFCNPLVN